MKRYSLYILTAGIVALVLASLHFGMQSYFNARRLQSELEIMTVRTRTMRVQLGELEQKRRALNRVQHFISQASAMGLNEDRWSRYAVNVEAPLSYAELGRVVEQCTHSRMSTSNRFSFMWLRGKVKTAPKPEMRPWRDGRKVSRDPKAKRPRMLF